MIFDSTRTLTCPPSEGISTSPGRSSMKRWGVLPVHVRGVIGFPLGNLDIEHQGCRLLHGFFITVLFASYQYTPSGGSVKQPDIIRGEQVLNEFQLCFPLESCIQLHFLQEVGPWTSGYIITALFIECPVVFIIPPGQGSKSFSPAFLSLHSIPKSF